MNPKVNWFFEKDQQWQEEYAKLRAICLSTGLTEELKWGQPCYTYQKKNIVLIHGFKEYCALLVFKGALLADPEGILIQQTENVQSPRQIRFRNLLEIIELEPVLKTYIHEAIEVEKAGLKVQLKTTEEYKVPEEFQHKLDTIPALKEAFEKLTPGRQRGYLFNFSKPKLPKTRQEKVEQYIPKILAGKGWDDE